MKNELRSSSKSNEQSWKQRVAAGAMGILALAGAVTIAEHYAAAVTCDPKIDNNCHPGGPGSTLPTLPEKGSTTTVPTTVPETTTVPTTVPHETTTVPTTVPHETTTVPHETTTVPHTPQTHQTAPPAVTVPSHTF